MPGMRFGKKEVAPTKCAACMCGGQQRTPIESNHTSQENKGALNKGKVQPGDMVHTCQHVCSMEGQNFNNQGQRLRHHPLKGGTIFCDAASNFMFAENQVGFAAHETTMSKLASERIALNVGATTKRHSSDNGVFRAEEFDRSLKEKKQTIRHSGVGGHHQN